jgi:glycosyltransferase involved in cell wall biosynthesis
MNLPLCAWIWSRRNVDHVAVMFHEVAYPFVRGQPLAHQLLAGVNRAMAWLVARASQRIFVSIPAWREVLRPLIDDFAACEWTPVPSNLPTCVNAAAVAAVRARYLQREDELLIGHFGTYGRNVAPLIHAAIPAVLSDRLRRGLLIGRGSEEFATESMTQHPALAGRLYATGGLASVDAAAHLAACDLLVQLYPDGISSRRSSAMAALPLGVPVVSSLGELSEPIWADAGAVALSPDASPQAVAQTVSKLAHNPLARAEVARRGRQLYFERFDVARTIDALLDQEW